MKLVSCCTDGHAGVVSQAIKLETVEELSPTPWINNAEGAIWRPQNRQKLKRLLTTILLYSGKSSGQREGSHAGSEYDGTVTLTEVE